MRFAIITLLLISLVGCVYPFFTNASVTVDQPKQVVTFAGSKIF